MRIFLAALTLFIAGSILSTTTELAYAKSAEECRAESYRQFPKGTLVKEAGRDERGNWVRACMAGGSYKPTKVGQGSGGSRISCMAWCNKCNPTPSCRADCSGKGSVNASCSVR